ncbi:AsnC family transcriptional regulator [Candidatus Micrarchaeota archaeon]|nr:AsnC family transcriptional regulator [Candidatus Micrarchaeota archaeon]
MDELDEKIIKLLKEDASTPLNKIADILKVPQPTVYVRVNKLRKDGTIRKFSIILKDNETEVRSAILDCRNFLISKMTARTVEKTIEKLKGEQNVLFVTKLGESKLLVGWKGTLKLDEYDDLVKIEKVETAYFSG